MAILVNSTCAHGWYVVKTVWPTRLAALYVHPNLPGGTPWEAWQLAGSCLLLVGISWIVWRLQRPYLTMGWLWFVGTLAPVNGLVQYGNLSRADRCMYIPMMGLLIMIVWGTNDLIEHVKIYRRVLKKVVVVVGAGVLVTASTTCWVQTGYWRNSMVFFERQISLVPNNPYYNSNMALVYYENGQFAEAIHYANKALAIWPRVWQSHWVLADVYTPDWGMPNWHDTIVTEAMRLQKRLGRTTWGQLRGETIRIGEQPARRTPAWHCSWSRPNMTSIYTQCDDSVQHVGSVQQCAPRADINSRAHDKESPNRCIRDKYYYRWLDCIFRFAVRRDARVLHVGCECGDLLAAIDPAYGVGIDSDIAAALTLARQRFPRLKVEVSDPPQPIPR